VLHVQWFESVQRLFGRRRRSAPPLIVPRAPIVPGREADSIITSPRAIAARGRAASTAEDDSLGPIADQRSAHDEAIRAALAGIANELEASELTDSRSRLMQIGLCFAAIVAVVIAFFLVRSPQREYALVGVDPARGAAGELANAQETAPRPLPAVSSSIDDTSGPLSRDTVSARRAARTETSRPVVSDIAVFPSAIRLSVGSTSPLTATLADADGNEITDRRVSWTSNKPKVATVSSKGVVKGRTVGTATITARSGGKRASTLVVVTRQSKGRR
jgi:hypothetical protein